MPKHAPADASARRTPPFLAAFIAVAIGLATGILLSLAASPLHAQAAATRPDTLVGRVTSDSAKAVANATVYVTRSSDRAVQQASTDADGRWQLVFTEGSGDYLVYASAAGFAPMRRRVQRQADETRFTVDLVLRPVAPQQLAAVRVRAQGPPPIPRQVRGGTEDVGSREQWNEGVSATLSPNARGDLAATAATLPGFTQGADGLSLLGAGGALATLNGAAIPNVQLPRAANLDARFTGTTFDATRGGFSGTNYDVRLGPGNRDFQQRNAFVTLDAPALTVTDATGRALGIPAGGGRLSFGADGELIRRTMTYNVALDVSRRVSSPASLFDADAGTLARVGLAADSAAALRAAATAAGVPLGAIGANTIRENVTWLTRFDDTRDTARTFAVSTLASFDRRRGVGLGPSLAPSAGADQVDAAGSLQLLSQRYFGRDRRVFNETRASVTLSRATGEPALAVPAASVLVGSGASADPTALAAVTLGGDPFAVRDQTRWIAEAANETAWYPTLSARHLVRTALWGRADGLRDASIANPYGTLRYNSIADLAADAPASFSRTIAQPARTGTALNGAAALSYRWNPSPQFQLISGARVEVNDLVGTPAANPALAQSLGVRTDAVPARVHVSPRAGFTWRPRNGPMRSGQYRTDIANVYRGTSGVLRGGIGEFRDLMRPDVLAAARGATGLADGTLGLGCVGTATPVPDWDAWAANPASIPSTCVGGGGPLALRAPSVQFIDPSYDVPRSWRANLGWTQDLKPFLLRVDALAAVNLNQQSRVDANFAGTTRFTTADEGRPVYVTPAAIDPSTGAVSLADSRRDATYGAVRGLRSDGRSDGAQVTAALQLDPFTLQSNVFASVSYTLQGLRQRFRGFDGAGVGDPTAFEWARANDDARHTVLFQVGTPIRSSTTTYGAFTLFARVQSGLPFTPIIQGDVDGDGTFGDRAFLFDPATDPDPSRAAAMRALLDGGPSWVRSCLQGQLGRMAGRNSCEGPWAVSTNARLDLNIPSRIVGRRLNVSINVANPLGGLDQLLNGENGLRGWGGPARPDPVLLVPRGFDAGAGRYAYSVNPRFGDTRPGRTLLRNPAQLSVDFSLDLTRDPSVQELERNIEPVGRGAWVRPSADTILARYAERVSSIHQALLDNADTLFLTRAQIEQSMQADTTFRDAAREIYRPLAEYLAALPKAFSGAEALQRVNAAEKAYQELFWKQRELVRERLTPLQLSALPPWIKQLLATRLDANWERWPRYIFRGGRVSVFLR